MKGLFQFLWLLLLVIPGIIKSYEYRMIPYILSENPKVSRQRAFEISKLMMNGNKWDTFVLDLLTKYLTISNMPVVSSQYWNMVHGHSPEEVKQDLEGMQTMRVLGRNMAWLIKCIELGKNNNVNKPELENREMTNFIRWSNEKKVIISPVRYNRIKKYKFFVY